MKQLWSRQADLASDFPLYAVTQTIPSILNYGLPEWALKDEEIKQDVRLRLELMPDHDETSAKT